MKKITTLILCIGISFSIAAQKSELKNVEKLIKSAKFSEATESLKGLEDLVIATKYESYYYFLEGKNAFGDDSTNDYVKAAKYFRKTLEVEHRVGKKDYSEKAINYLNTISDYYYKIINKTLKAEDYAKTGDAYEILWNITPGRKDLLENVLYSRLQTKNYTESAKILENLLKSLGTTVYTAVNKETSKNNEFFNKEARDKEVELGLNIGGEETKVESNIRLDYYTNLAAIYDQQGNYEKEIVKLKEAKKEFPTHAPFYESYATVIYRSGDEEAYVEALEDVLELSPEKTESWYNLGVISQNSGQAEKALLAYDKVIELDPNYRDAYINKGLIILNEEKPLINKLNDNRGTKEYSVIKDQITAVYLKAIPFFEKAYSLKKDEEVKANLKGLYIAIEDTAKAKALEN